MKNLEKFKLIHCEVCQENWPILDHNDQCKRCTSEKDQPHFGKSNGMVRDHTAIPMNIRLLLDELTMVEGFSSSGLKDKHCSEAGVLSTLGPVFISSFPPQIISSKAHLLALVIGLTNMLGLCG
jgi:hypothetical protein